MRSQVGMVFQKFHLVDIAAKLNIPFPPISQPTINALDEEELAQRVGIVMWVLDLENPIDWRSYRDDTLSYYEETIMTVITSSNEAPQDL